MTVPTSRLARLRADIDLATTVAANLDTALDRMDDARRGQPGSGSGFGGGQKGGTGSPVERALGLDQQPRPGETGFQFTRDHGAEAVATVDKALSAVRTALERLDTVVAAWTPHYADGKAQRATEAANVEECAHCRATLNRHEPMHRRTDAGCLPTKMPLCRWDMDFAGTRERLPTSAEKIRHDKGLKVKVPA